jgi:anti-sigma factor RsiW
MGCERFEFLISGLLDGELDAAEEQLLKEHLLVCDKCRRKHEELLRL